MQLKINPINFKQSQHPKQNNQNSTIEIIKDDLGIIFGHNAETLSLVYAVKKSQEINRLKREIIKAYDLIYEDMAKEAKEMGIDFVKPKLIFKPFNNNVRARYAIEKNEIHLNSRHLKPKSFSRFNNGGYYVQKLADGKEIPCLDFVYSPWAKYIEEDAIYIEGDEKLYSYVGSIKHELTHARQEQIMLSGENGLKKLYIALKKKHPKQYAHFSFESFKKILPFASEYKPLKTLKSDEKITTTYPNLHDKNGNLLQISYTPNDIVNLRAGYELDNKTEYYNNLMEIEARAEQAEFFLNYKKYLPNIDIPDETIDYYFRCLHYICQMMLQS